MHNSYGKWEKYNRKENGKQGNTNGTWTENEGGQKYVRETQLRCEEDNRKGLTIQGTQMRQEKWHNR